MEIKKYVLLKNNRIYNLQNEKEVWAKSYNIVKTSDNILDLVGVEDMVMSDDYVGALKVLSNTKHYFRTYHAIVSKKNVKAIYKRQLNGDYKRYEVSEKI